MADLSVSPSCGQVQPADPTAKPIDAAEAVLIPVEDAAEAVLIPVEDAAEAVLLPVEDAAEAVLIPAEEELKKAAEKIKADVSKTETKIHRFPERLRHLSKDGRYIVPSVVAIGPYHRRLSQLQKMEEVKNAAAYNFCIDSGHSSEEVYKKILSVSGDARSCYDNRDEAMEAGMDDAEFAAMMFRDGCFLLQYIIFDTGGKVDSSLESWFLSNETGLARDVMLLENQLPWLVLDALMTFSSVPLGQFIVNWGESFDVRSDLVKKEPSVWDYARYKPQHLLALLLFYQSGEVLPDSVPRGITSVPQSSSAIELGEIGIKLIASKTTRFNDIGTKILGPLCGKLFVAPLVMDDFNACCLVNMVVLEDCMPYGAATVTSYIFLLAMLMNREEDVHELRVKSILHGDFSDQQTLDFFKNLVEQLSRPNHHTLLLAQLEAYKRKRWVWIAVHKFVYNNFKTIVTVLTVIGVLVGIFKTLLSLKQHQP